MQVAKMIGAKIGWFGILRNYILGSYHYSFYYKVCVNY